jgi:transposase InsO family protein
MRVTRSGFYAWTRRGLSARAQRDLVLRTKLRAFHAASGHRYGRPRLWNDLKEDGEAVGEKRVKRLMREKQVQGKVPKRFKHTTNSDHDDPIAANVLDATSPPRVRINAGSATRPSSSSARAPSCIWRRFSICIPGSWSAGRSAPLMIDG